ncbi:Reductase [Hexamita inflata]|uniref:Putative n=1 Tax=Hexamita inflata TaxID=28002 RepID=A0AA86PLC3_9EUKA|nr:Reductase [Hexamita inflata]
MGLCKFLLTLILISASFFYYLTQYTNLIKKYKCKYAVITGSTGGIGKELTSQLIKKMNVITVARNPAELEKIQEQYKDEQFKIVPFVFDFVDDLNTFSDKFDQFLTEKGIDKQEVGMCFSNAGYGDYKPFESYNYIEKAKFVQVNFDAHLAICDYFCKLFLTRKNTKSALVITSSALSHTPGKYFALYHTTKAALSSLGNALYAEYRRKGIDVLVVHPSSVSNTKFYQHKGIKAEGDKTMPVIGQIENSFIAVTPKQVVNRMLTRVGKINQSQVGWAAVSTALFATCSGRNIQGWIWSLFSLNDKLVK